MNLPRSPVSSFGPLPLVIGVVGHRDLRDDDVPTLQAQVHDIARELRELYPSTPLLILSALAEGADRLVARVALELGAGLIVPLPLPRAWYEEDFESSKSRAEFAELLNRAEHYFELPPIGDFTEEQLRAKG